MTGGANRGDVRRELRTRFEQYLRAHPGQRFCATCLGRALVAPSKMLHDAGLKIEQRPGFAREYARCSTCDRVRVVVAAVADLEGT